jgi:mercuric ion transport protein
MPEPLERNARRWGLPAIGLAALAGVGCCALPALGAGSIVGGSLAVLHGSCLAPLAILLLVVGVAASAVWLRRLCTDDKCVDSADCECASDPEAKMLQPNMFRPGP